MPISTTPVHLVPISSAVIAQENSNRIRRRNRKPKVDDASLDYTDTSADDSFSNQTGTISAKTGKPTARICASAWWMGSINPAIHWCSMASATTKPRKAPTSPMAPATATARCTSTAPQANTSLCFNDAGIERLHDDVAITFNVTATDNHPTNAKTSKEADITINFTAVDDVNSISLGSLSNFTEQTDVVIAPNAVITAERDGITELQVELTSPSQSNGALEFTGSSYLQSASNVDDLNITGDITVEAWVKLDEYPSNGTLIAGNSIQEITTQPSASGFEITVSRTRNRWNSSGTHYGRTHHTSLFHSTNGPTCCSQP